ncbi:hypothetical protein AALA90_10675 [Lachnospiraceae bacterium 38-10]
MVTLIIQKIDGLQVLFDVVDQDALVVVLGEEHLVVFCGVGLLLEKEEGFRDALSEVFPLKNQISIYMIKKFNILLKTVKRARFRK